MPFRSDPFTNIATVNSVGSNLVISGTGPTNESYYVPASTNVAWTVSNWTRIATNQFNGLGQFSFTNAISPATPQNFYRLQLP